VSDELKGRLFVSFCLQRGSWLFRDADCRVPVVEGFTSTLVYSSVAPLARFEALSTV